MYCRWGRFWGFVIIAFGAGIVVASLIPAFILTLLVGLGLIALGCLLCR
ncbi:MAG: hypothetical protein FWG36_03555 [Oscillospiraceae bacterium]|nr:hypothetical protein [Oscillospiraceae bacterium]